MSIPKTTKPYQSYQQNIKLLNFHSIFVVFSSFLPEQPPIPIMLRLAFFAFFEIGFADFSVMSDVVRFRTLHPLYRLPRIGSRTEHFYISADKTEEECTDSTSMSCEKRKPTL